MNYWVLRHPYSLGWGVKFTKPGPWRFMAQLHLGAKTVYLGRFT